MSIQTQTINPATTPTQAQADDTMVFDSAPVTQTTPVTGPDTSIVFDSQPTTQAITVPAVTSTPAPATQPAPTAPAPQYSWSATPDTTFADKAKNWANNVASDLRHGTDLTKVGTILKALGAHGLEMGVTPQTAEFFGSMPLGLLQATQGGAELTQPGNRWEGAKNVVGGLLDASTMPSAFMAPEGAELAGSGLDATASAIGSQAGKAATAIENAVSMKNIQPALQAEMRSIFAGVAKDANVQPSAAASIRDVAANTATAIQNKASGIYKQLDAATGGRFQRFDDALTNISRGIREAAGIDPETEAALIQRQQEVQTAREGALQTAKAAGVDPGLIADANRLYRQSMSLENLSRHIRMSTEGVPAQLAQSGSGSKAVEIVNVQKLLPRLNGLLDKGRLQTALPGDALQRLYTAVQTSKEAAEGVQAVQRWAKRIATATGLGAAGALGYDVVKHLFE